jgi:glycosyltransferase involved in cell wall biosynthesis
MTNLRTPIRTIVVQPTLASYRVPVYRELAARPQIDLRVWFGEQKAIHNATPDGFVAEAKPIHTWNFAGQEALWHSAQIEAAGQADADAIVLGWSSRYLSLGPALRRARRAGKSVVLWGHGVSKRENAFRRWNRNRIARYATALLFYDEVNAQAAISHGIPADRVFVAPNALDQTAINAARSHWLAHPDELAAFRQTHELVGRKVLLFVSRLTPENRLELLIEAVRLLKSDHPEVLAVLVGGGAEETVIRGRIREAGVEDYFKLVGPIYDQHDLAPWFLSAEAFAYPSTIGLSLLHAFGYGLPVVTNDNVVGHGPEIVAFQPDPDRPGANGLAYRNGDAADFAAKLGRLLNDRSLRDHLAEGAYQTVELKYNVRNMVNGMVAAIERGMQ